MRAIWVFWRPALQEPDRLLDDLATWTDINAITVSNTYFSELEPERGEPLALGSVTDLDGLPVATVPAEEFASMLGFAELAKSKGFKVASNVTPLHPHSSDLDSLACIDITGRRVVTGDRTVHGCPNNPDLVRYGTAVVRETVASWTSIDALDINHVEYPRWPRDGLRDLFVCFCDFCREKAEAFGIDFDGVQREAAWLYRSLTTPGSPGRADMSGFSPSELLAFLIERPLLAVWLSFRTESMSEFITKIAEAGREAANEYNPGLQLGMEAHLPSMSALFGTDYAKLHPLFDWVAPKFPDYVPGGVIPAVADEVASETGRWDKFELMRAIREMFDLGPGPEEYLPSTLPEEQIAYSNSFDTSIIGRQMRHLAPLVGKVPMYPWLWLYNNDLDLLRDKVRTLRDNGFDGYFLWTWESHMSSESLRSLKMVF